MLFPTRRFWVAPRSENTKGAPPPRQRFQNRWLLRWPKSGGGGETAGRAPLLLLLLPPPLLTLAVATAAVAATAVDEPASPQLRRVRAPCAGQRDQEQAQVPLQLLRQRTVRRSIQVTPRCKIMAACQSDTVRRVAAHMRSSVSVLVASWGRIVQLICWVPAASKKQTSWLLELAFHLHWFLCHSNIQLLCHALAEGAFLWG